MLDKKNPPWSGGNSHSKSALDHSTTGDESVFKNFEWASVTPHPRETPRGVNKRLNEAVKYAQKREVVKVTAQIDGMGTRLHIADSAKLNRNGSLHEKMSALARLGIGVEDFRAALESLKNEVDRSIDYLDTCPGARPCVIVEAKYLTPAVQG